MSLVYSEKILNTDVEVHASRHGMWEILVPIEDGGHTTLGRGDTLDKAKNQARSELSKRKVKVEVPFFHPQTGQAGVATGLHARNGSILVRYDDGATDQVRFHFDVLAPTTPPEKIEEMCRKEEESRRLAREVQGIRQDYKMSLGHTVERAIDSKITDQEVAKL